MDKDSTQQTATNTENANNNAVECLPLAETGAVKKRFQVDIFDKVVHGEPPMEKITLEKVHYDNPVIIEASCKKDLDNFAAKLALCQLTFKIVKVIDDVSNQQTATVNAKPVAVPNTVVQKPVLQVKKQKPKYYKVGDIELKDDNGKIYQKQWLRLTDAEASNFRIINDKTNSIFNLKDRHIEMKKWVLVDSTEDTTDLEDSLND